MFAIANVIYLCVVLNLLGLRLLRCLLGLRLCKGVSARAGGLVQRTVVLNDELQDGVGAQCLDGEGLGGVAFCTRSISVGCGLSWGAVPVSTVTCGGSVSVILTLNSTDGFQCLMMGIFSCLKLLHGWEDEVRVRKRENMGAS